ncbi:hypothetical protein BJV78DRAFT_1386056 [Lactifluus subvellereus]|nr:hypothetical protein BJV78DRAFT_1386056 [Lactifluus subvellereus]
MTITPDSERSNYTPPMAFGPPFDDADADIIFRSSDQVDFHVYKVILSKASPFFKDMFSLPQPVTQNSRTVIDLPESSKTIAALLTAIYPVPASETEEERSLSDHLAAIKAAKKYDMAVALTYILRDFEGSACVEDRPVEAFCIAYTLKLGEAAQTAAKASLKHRLSLDDLGNELQHTNGPALFQLWQFHRACSAAAVTAIPNNDLTWVSRKVQSSWWELAELDHRMHCECKKHTFSVGQRSKTWEAHASWSNYINRARDALKEQPCGEAVTDHDILKPSYKEPMCKECQRRICGLSEFSRYLGEEVEKRVSEVVLNLPF